MHRNGNHDTNMCALNGVQSKSLYDQRALSILNTASYLCICERACVKLYNRVSSTKPLDLQFLKDDDDDDEDKSVTLFLVPDSLDVVTRQKVSCNSAYECTGGLPYPRVIRSKTYRGYVKPQIIHIVPKNNTESSYIK